MRVAQAFRASVRGAPEVGGLCLGLLGWNGWVGRRWILLCFTVTRDTEKKELEEGELEDRCHN